MTDILETITDGEHLQWRIFDLWATKSTALKGSMTIPKLEQSIKQSPQGYLLSWHDLSKLTLQFDQIIDAVITGCRDDLVINDKDDAKELIKKSEIFIEMVDSSYWRVFAKDDTIIDRLRSKFKDTQLLPTIPPEYHSD